MCSRVFGRSLESVSGDSWKEVNTMIDWDSDTWGGGVHYAANGSWVADKHGDDADGQD